MAPRPKHDYDHPDFYKLIEQYAMNGYSDREIANELDLSPDVFGSMKNGNYARWTEEENQERSTLIDRGLARGRTKVNAIVRSTYLKTAVGGKKITSSSKRFVQDRCVCMGEDKKCPECGGSGWVILTDKAIFHETETELPPNVQALSTWLHLHDEEWRKASEGLSDSGANKIEGITINVSYNKAEDLNLQGVAGDEETTEEQ